MLLGKRVGKPGISQYGLISERLEKSKQVGAFSARQLEATDEFRFEGTQVYIRRMGNAVVLLPEHDTWQVLFESLDSFSADFMLEREQPPQQDREALFE